MMMMMMISMCMSIILPLMKHPISMGSMLIVQTIIISMISSMKFYSSWYSYILFITIIGGMMVMFMYMSSIASNEKFKMMSMKKITSIMIMLTIFMITYKFYYTTMNLEKLNETKLFFMEFEEIKSTSKFMYLNKMNLTIMMMIILLLTMISITNITSSYEGPLKMK
uniref:NADH-ubiquinone oxidoreductase chain 6 n=1 Tax=Bambusicaliscelis fanjingensis TaxID=2820089 RepID=A0A8A4VNE1_9HEMI|nr:NADH dehydrogenase subunit 6 [Bambusicaliscelis fanjingensis]QTD82423.1 NADH dehydrogenase subunit 6 [Bambusicaliscelis fanjingensis]